MMKRFIAAAAAVFCSAAGWAAEQNYDFRTRLGCLHPPRRAGDAAPANANETAVDSSWKIVVLSDDPVIRHAAADLADYFAKSMNEDVKLAQGAAGAKTIAIGIAHETNRLTARVTVSADRIRITGATAREAAQGCYRLEDAMNFRGIPALERGEKTFTRMFSPRMVHSGWELDKYPDVYLDHLAHMGMDAVLTYVTESPDMTRNGREDMPDLVRRAAVRGLDVYVYAHQIAAASHMHPDDPDAAEFCDRLWGSIVKNAPGLKGMVFVGESIAFTSKDPTIQGFWWKRVPGSKRLNGFYPTLEWVPWLKHVRDATRKYRPDFDIVFWTYNWSRQPEKERLALLEKIPDDITVHVTFEMGDSRPQRNGVNDDVDDYSILHPGPSRMFTGEASVVSRRGIRLTAMANTGGRTWDCGVTPFVPVPERWIDRHRALRDAHRRWNLAGLMESHHYGFQPNFIAEIAKVSFTEESDDSAVRETLRGIAARDFGCMNVDAVIDAWRDWSEAFLFHSARSFDQYGPLRIGPAFAFVLPGEPWPLPPHPQYEWYEGRRYGNGWKYLGSSYDIPESQIAGRLKTTEKELALWRRGNERLASALANVPAVKRPYAERMLGLGRFFEHTVRTVRNSILFKRDGLALTDPKSSGAEREAAARRLYAVLDDEEKNVRETIPLVDVDSSLGWEPSMFYVADREHLEWKLRQLGDARMSVSERSPADTFRKRLWMWGHHAHAFRTSSGNERKWFGPDHLDMGAACLAMGIPNVSVCRWQALPKPPFDAAVKELSGLSGFGWSITDNDGDYSFAEKANIALDLAKRHPKLNSFWLDDYFASSFVRPEVELFRLKNEMLKLPQSPKLTVVFYSTEFNRNPKPTFDACDQISFWVYDANDIPQMEERLAKCRELAGPGKPILLGIYMWNFPKKAEIPRASMQRQLDLAERLMRTGAIHGLVFHCTPLVDTGLEAVEMCKEWIRRHGEDPWGAERDLR